MNKKGFTLIELLAVIVVLAIIALIATPMVLNTIDESRKGAAKESANAYVHALETKVVSSMINGTTIEPKQYTVGDIAVDIKGTNADSGVYCVGNNGTITKYSLKVSGYVIEYNGISQSITKDGEVKTDLQCMNSSYVGEWSLEDAYISGQIVLYEGAYYIYSSSVSAGDTRTPSMFESGYGVTRYLPNYNQLYTEIDSQYKGSTDSIAYKSYGRNGIYYNKSTEQYVYVQFSYGSSSSQTKLETPLPNYNPYDSTTWDI